MNSFEHKKLSKIPSHDRPYCVNKNWRKIIWWLNNHHLVLLARISLTLSWHPSLSSIASERSSRLYPASTQSCWMYVLAGHPTFTRPYDGVPRSMLLMSSSLLLQTCPTCLARLTLIVFVMGSMWWYSCCFMGCCP